MTKLPLRYFEERKASRSKIQLGGGHLFDGFLAGLKKFSSRCAKEKREYMEEHVCVLIHVRAWERNRPLWLAGWPPSCAAPIRTRTRTLLAGRRIHTCIRLLFREHRLCWAHKTVAAAVDIWITWQCMCVGCKIMFVCCILAFWFS
jgi:hypothetical protein